MMSSQAAIPSLTQDVLARVSQLFEHELVLVLILDQHEQVLECRVISLVDAMALLAQNEETNSNRKGENP